MSSNSRASPSSLTITPVDTSVLAKSSLRVAKLNRISWDFQRCFTVSGYLRTCKRFVDVCRSRSKVEQSEEGLIVTALHSSFNQFEFILEPSVLFEWFSQIDDSSNLSKHPPTCYLVLAKLIDCVVDCGTQFRSKSLQKQIQCIYLSLHGSETDRLPTILDPSEWPDFNYSYLSSNSAPFLYENLPRTREPIFLAPDLSMGKWNLIQANRPDTTSLSKSNSVSSFMIDPKLLSNVSDSGCRLSSSKTCDDVNKRASRKRKTSLSGLLNSPGTNFPTIPSSPVPTTPRRSKRIRSRSNTAETPIKTQSSSITTIAGSISKSLLKTARSDNSPRLPSVAVIPCVDDETARLSASPGPSRKFRPSPSKHRSAKENTRTRTLV